MSTLRDDLQTCRIRWCARLVPVMQYWYTRGTGTYQNFLQGELSRYLLLFVSQKQGQINKITRRERHGETSDSRTLSRRPHVSHQHRLRTKSASRLPLLPPYIHILEKKKHSDRERELAFDHGHHPFLWYIRLEQTAAAAVVYRAAYANDSRSSTYQTARVEGFGDRYHNCPKM